MRKERKSKNFSSHVETFTSIDNKWFVNAECTTLQQTSLLSLQMADMERKEKELKEIDQELLKQRIVQDQKVTLYYF